MQNLNKILSLFLTVFLFNTSLLSANTKRTIHNEKYTVGDIITSDSCLENLNQMSEGSFSRAYCNIPTGINRTTFFFATPFYKEIRKDIKWSKNVTCSAIIVPRFRSRRGLMQIDFHISDDNVSQQLLDICVEEAINELKDTWFCN